MPNIKDSENIVVTQAKLLQALSLISGYVPGNDNYRTELANAWAKLQSEIGEGASGLQAVAHDTSLSGDGTATTPLALAKVVTDNSLKGSGISGDPLAYNGASAIDRWQTSSTLETAEGSENTVEQSTLTPAPSTRTPVQVGDIIVDGAGTLATVTAVNGTTDCTGITQGYQAGLTGVTVNSPLSGTGTAQDPVDIAKMGGATSTTDGTEGIVQAPSAGDQDSFWSGDGTWKVPNQGGGFVEHSEITTLAELFSYLNENYAQNVIFDYNGQSDLVVDQGVITDVIESGGNRSIAHVNPVVLEVSGRYEGNVFLANGSIGVSFVSNHFPDGSSQPQRALRFALRYSLDKYYLNVFPEIVTDGNLTVTTFSGYEEEITSTIANYIISNVKIA